MTGSVRMATVAGALATAAMVAATATPAGAQADNQPGVQVLHAAARLVVIAEPRTDVSVTVAHGPSRLPPLTVRRQGPKLVVDGGLTDGTVRCAGGPPVSPLGWLFGNGLAGTPGGGQHAAVVRGIGRIDYADLPIVTAHVPLDAAAATSGAVWSEVGATRSLKLAALGCGDWRVGDVRGELDVASTGSTDVQAADAGRLRAALFGSGDLRLGRVADGAQIAVQGSGDLRAASIRGDVKIAAAGSGDVTVQSVEGPVEARNSGSSTIRLLGGHAPTFQGAATGSGDIVFGGQAGSVQAAVAGSGDIRIAHVSGPIRRARSGSGEVQIGP